MSNYMDRLYETDEQRNARLAAKPKRKRKTKAKATGIKVAPRTKPTAPSLGNTMNVIKRRNKYISNL